MGRSAQNGRVGSVRRAHNHLCALPAGEMLSRFLRFGNTVANLPHGRLDFIVALRRRELVQVCLCRQFNVGAKTIGPSSRFKKQFAGRARDGFQMYVAAKTMLGCAAVAQLARTPPSCSQHFE